MFKWPTNYNGNRKNVDDMSKAEQRAIAYEACREVMEEMTTNDELLKEIMSVVRRQQMN